MTKPTLARLIIPLAAAGLALAACGSMTAEESAAPAAAASMAASDEMASEKPDEMASEMASEEPDEMADSTESAAPAAAAGSYVTLTQYEDAKDMYDGGDVVLFFAADWCPTCQEATENLEGDPAAIPAGLTIVRVDYDDSDELKQKYGVTTQHTFVQVDASGDELAKWTGSVTADEIEKQTT